MSLQRREKHSGQIWHTNTWRRQPIPSRYKNCTVTYGLKCTLCFSISKWRNEVEIQLEELMPNTVPVGTEESLVNTSILSQPFLTSWPKAHLENHSPRTVIKNSAYRGIQDRGTERVQSALSLSPGVQITSGTQLGKGTMQMCYTEDKRLQPSDHLSSVPGTTGWKGSGRCDTFQQGDLEIHICWWWWCYRKPAVHHPPREICHATHE